LCNEIKQHLKHVTGTYLASFKKSCEAVLAALSSGNLDRMRTATEALRQQSPEAEELANSTSRLMSRFGVDPAEGSPSSNAG
jgi:hypothetical protein